MGNLSLLDGTQKKSILIIGASYISVEQLRVNLEKEGYNVLVSYIGDDTLYVAQVKYVDLVVLDDIFPNRITFGMLKAMRELGLPVIILSTQNSEANKTYALEGGAEDYVVKPFSHRELMSRIKAILRRIAWASKESTDAILRIDDQLQIDLKQREVIVQGKRKKLSAREFQLLSILIQNAGWTVSHERLLQLIWGINNRFYLHYVRLYIDYLREKIEINPASPQYIILERGVGYQFVELRGKAER